MLRKGLYSVIILVALVFLGKGFLLFSGDVFGYHDITQAGRVSEFVTNLRSLQLPPRIAPSFSFGMGYPIFNHYAPFAYWVTGLMTLIGVSTPLALKLSFFMAVVVAGVSMYFFLNEYFHEYSALVGGVLYASSPYIALEIFVRGNLAELWFLSLLPLVLFLSHKVVSSSSNRWFIALAFSFSFLMTAHNALSIIGGAFVLLYGLLFHNKKVVYALGVGGLLSAYFLVPAVLELASTHATSIATQTSYIDHFVCPRQLWNSPLGYGGSTAGCSDGMSFQVGKVLLSVGVVGILLYIFRHLRYVVKHTSMRIENRHVITLCGLTLITLFLSLGMSQPIWEALDSFLELFQFPWRFLGFFVFGLSFFAAYAVNHTRYIKYMWVLVAAVALTAILLGAQFFIPNPDKTWSNEDFMNEFVSKDYLRNEIVYRVPEYVPTSVDIDAWLNTQGNDVTNEPLIVQDGELFTTITESPFSFEVGTSSRSFLINKHYAPYWNIHLNGEKRIPTDFDELGRPIMTTDAEKTIVKVTYTQTSLQWLANMLTLVGVALLLLPYAHTWKRKP